MAKSSKCQCNPGFLCGDCLSRAKPYFFTPTSGPFYFSKMNDLADKAEELKAAP